MRVASASINNHSRKTICSLVNCHIVVKFLVRIPASFDLKPGPSSSWSWHEAGQSLSPGHDIVMGCIYNFWSGRCGSRSYFVCIFLVKIASHVISC